MKHEIIPVGPLSTNCHLVFDENKRELFLIDPGAEPEKIIRAAKKYDFASARILLTHAHIDHISGCGQVAGELGVAEVELSPADIPMYNSEDNHFFPYFPRAVNLPPGVPFRPMAIGTILELPGHTQGGSGILFDDGESKFLLSGDTIFNCSIGRTDLPGGNYGMLISSIRTQILTLPEDLEIFPGHGTSTTVGNERVNNPFLSMR